MSTVAQFNARKLARVLQSLRRLLWGLSLILGALLLFFAYQGQRAVSREVTYVVTPEATYPTHRGSSAGSAKRSSPSLGSPSDRLVGAAALGSLL